MSAGVFLYTGVPESGKTTLALRNAGEDVAKTGWPLLVLDSEGTVRRDDIMTAGTVREAVELVYREGRHTRIVPQGEEDVDRVARAVRAGRRVVLLIDEIGYWASAHGTPESLERLIRGHRHREVALHATTQYPGDLAPVVHSCLSGLYAFRTFQRRALDKLAGDYALDAEKLKVLGQGEYLLWRRGFH